MSNDILMYLLIGVGVLFAVIVIAYLIIRKKLQSSGVREIQKLRAGTEEKKFTKEKDIDSLMPFKDINEQGVIIYDNYYAVVLEVGQKEFGIEDD